MSRVDGTGTGVGFQPDSEPLEGTDGSGDAGGVCTPEEPPGLPGDGVDLAGSDLFSPLEGGYSPATPAAGGGGLRLDDFMSLLAKGAAALAGPGAASKPAAAGPPADAAQIGSNLDDVKLTQSQEKITVHNPWDFNQLAPKNAGGKKTQYKQLKQAEKQLGKAEKAEASASKALEQAQQKHAASPSDKTAAAVASAETKLDRAKADVAKAEKALVKEENDLRAVLKKLSPGKDKDDEIDALNLRGRPFTRDEFTVKVDGQAVKLENGVDSYATTDAKGLTGNAVGDSKALVGAAIDRSGFSDSVKNVLKGTSANEGTFSTINGYDRKNITFGFIQMAGGKPGDSLSNMLAAFKKEHPAAFADTLQKYGMDVEYVKGKPQLVVREPDGNVLKGDAAAKKMGTDPKLAGALAAAGMNTDMQDSQLRFAKDYLDRQRENSISAGGQKVEIKDLITSERGNGILFDRSVHGGMAGARNLLTDVAGDYLTAHPGAKLSDESVRAGIEAAYISRVSSNPDLQSRCDNIAARTSDARGTYKE